MRSLPHNASSSSPQIRNRVRGLRHTPYKAAEAVPAYAGMTFLKNR
ncbi:hypothetical protein [Neisseria bacilliformis]|uniref:Glutamine synthetase n=1 Tax=Neisseria bacilliformis ATCC BAA-1200 TaxID=888742 RepID=F2BD37_9NEIS|nr:hypothetical protein [Neisseria bacilliformis]EGF10761.1 glutamine synthetase [Neisseria bacilliformis ATCC BAA-1200]